MPEIVVDAAFAGPPAMGHGGWVAAILADRIVGAAEVTLRRPTPADAEGAVERRWVLAALDCPGSMAFIARGSPAGLLGRIVFDQLAPARPDVDHVVTGWQIGRGGRRLYAGTALATADGTVLAAARATWFPWPDA